MSGCAVRLLLTIIATLCTMLLPKASMSAGTDGHYMNYGIGTFSCGRYLAEKDRDARLSYKDWLGGYLTAYNRQTKGIHDVGAGTDLDGAFGWIANYCKDHPTDNFAAAASELTDFLQSKLGEKEPDPVQPTQQDYGIFDDIILPKTSSEFPEGESVFVKYRGTLNLRNFDCYSVTRSSFVHKICFDPANSYMLIKLSDTWYHYCEIDQGTVSSMIHAQSVGEFYNSSVKGSFDCRTHRVPAY